MSIDDEIETYLAQSLVAEKVKALWRGTLKNLSAAQKQELLKILESEKSALQNAMIAENQKKAPQNQALYRQLLLDLENLARTFKASGLKSIENKTKAEEEQTLESLEQKLSDT